MSLLRTPDEWWRAHNAFMSLVEFAKETTTGVQWSDVSRISMAQTLWVVCIEDMEAIGLLLKSRLLASARALARPQFESLCRGAWLATCASDHVAAEVANYRSHFPMFSELFRQVTNAAEPFNVLGTTVPLQVLKTRIVESMHDFTHRGTRTIALRGISAAGGENWIDETEPAIFHLAALIGCTAAAAILDGSGNESGAAEVLAKLDETARSWGHDPSATSVA